MSVFEKNPVLKAVFDFSAEDTARAEDMKREKIVSLMEEGRAVLLGNPNHKNVKPVLVGGGARVKVNANIGTSPLECSPEAEFKKLKIAEESGADTVMDLSIGGDLDAIRTRMLSMTRLPVGTVPIYAVAKRYADKGRKPEDIDMSEVFEEMEKQGEQGVDFMTVHTGIDLKGAYYGDKCGRTLGIVSRGGSMLARWMLKNGRENPLLTDFDKILNIALKYNITLSLGDGLRPGALSDAGDAAQWQEVINLGRQAGEAAARGVQCMIEGPGHVSLDLVEAQIKGIKSLTGGAPLYILGPLVIDNSPGYDHISGAIGAAAAVRAGADFLCYLTPAEHLTLPDENDVKQGVMASRIAAAAGEAAMGRKSALNIQKKMSQARQKLDWEAMKEAAVDPSEIDRRRKTHKDKKECAMCGEFCSVKLQH